MAEITIVLSIMLFEGGVLIDSLSGKTQGQALADKIEQADDAALAAGHVEFDLALSPKEVGMAINALTKGSSDLGRQLGQRLETKLSEKLAELGIEYGSGGGGLDQQAPLGGDEQPTAPDETGDEPGEETEPEQGPAL